MSGCWRDQDGSRVHFASLDEGGARLCPCGITTAIPQHVTVVSWPTDENQPRSSPPQTGWVRTAPGPYPPDLSQYTLKRRKRRFLAYSFPSRSPDPHHLAVLTRPGLVRAACHPPRRHPDQAALSSTRPAATGQEVKVSHLHSKHSASRRTRRFVKTDPQAILGFEYLSQHSPW